jgi:hypothetical protein
VGTHGALATASQWAAEGATVLQFAGPKLFPAETPAIAASAGPSQTVHTRVKKLDDGDARTDDRFTITIAENVVRLGVDGNPYYSESRDPSWGQFCQEPPCLGVGGTQYCVTNQGGRGC